MTDDNRSPGPRRLPSTTDASREARDARRSRLLSDGHTVTAISGAADEPDPASLSGSIEGFIGYAQVPIGIAGPVHIRGQYAQGDFIVPLATTEGTLVASYQHAFNAINRGGGAADKDS